MIKIQNIQIENFISLLGKELLFRVDQNIELLEKLKSQFGIGLSNRDTFNETESNIPKLIYEYEQAQALLKQWIGAQLPLSERIEIFSLFDVKADNNKTTTFFVAPFKSFPDESFRAQGYEKARIPFKSSLRIASYSVQLIDSENDFMDSTVEAEIKLHRDQNRSARWEKGLGGDKGDFILDGPLITAKILHIYKP
jgi:hypothetical protein